MKLKKLERLLSDDHGCHQLSNGIQSNRFSYTSPPPSPSSWVTNNHYRYSYSTIPEGDTTTPEVPPSPRKKMELKDSSPEEFRKELEEELKLPNDDIRSHAWFHGGISREKAEKQIRENGDFLVRDSISRPGSFVLTVRWKNSPMHFVINRVVVQAETPYASVQYQFEKECFSCIPSLIRYYIGNCKPVSQASGAVIQRPVNRTLPLSYIDGRYAEFSRVQGSANHIYSALPNMPKKVVTPKSLIGSSLRQRCDSQPSVFRPRCNTMERSGSQPLFDVKHNGVQQLKDDEQRPLERTGSEPILTPSVERRPLLDSVNKDYVETRGNFGSDSKIAVKPTAPGKPIRTLNVREHTYQEIPSPNGDLPSSSSNDTSSSSNGSLSSNGSQSPNDVVVDGGDSVRFSRLHDHETTPKYVLPEENHNDTTLRRRIFSDTRNSMLDTSTYSVVGKDHLHIKENPVKEVVPLNETSSVFHPLELKTSFFGSENKPLEASAMIETKRILLEEEPLLLAKHMTSVDLEVCRIINPGSNTLPGLELLTLPPGRQLRHDLLERFNCLKTWLSISLLTTVEKETRVELLCQWIQIAECLKSNMGNMFGFAAIMDGLGSQQVCNLKQTWDGLRMKFTSTAVTYETKLHSLFKSLNNGENVISLTKTCIPHIIPVIQVLERDWAHLDVHDWSQPASQDVLNSLPSGKPWEESSICFGMEPMLNHLQNAHMFAQQGKMFRINADTKLQKFLLDEDMLVMFRTDFHLRILWGSKGALVKKEERYKKYERVLTVMSEKLEQTVIST